MSDEPDAVRFILAFPLVCVALALLKIAQWLNHAAELIDGSPCACKGYRA